MKTLDKKFWWIFTPFSIFIIIILFFPAWFVNNSIFNLDFTTSGQIGDTIGGILGPFIAIVAAFLTFFAFWVQYKANEQQKMDLQIERFESKFYNMVDIHRLNVTEIVVGRSLTSRKAFISMFNELKFLYLATDYYLNLNIQKDLIKSLTGKNSLSKDNIFNIAYLIFFFGIGPNSTKLIMSLVNPQISPIILNLEVYLKGQQTNWRTNKVIGIEEKQPNRTVVFELRTSYKPFNGHMSRLSHYIRHLFQLIKFIDQQSDKIIDYEAKYAYAATVRAQLSAHEQLLLYYNALSVLGEPWIDDKNDFFNKYCMVKSIPLPLADFYKKPLDIFPEINKHGKPMFEWTEVQERLNNH
jgi:hypothetical protein